MLNWFKSAPGRNKYKYDVTDTQWIDIESVICIIALSFKSNSNIYTLEENDRQVLDEFVSKTIWALQVIQVATVLIFIF